MDRRPRHTLPHVALSDVQYASDTEEIPYTGESLFQHLSKVNWKEKNYIFIQLVMSKPNFPSIQLTYPSSSGGLIGPSLCHLKSFWERERKSSGKMLPPLNRLDSDEYDGAGWIELCVRHCSFFFLGGRWSKREALLYSSAGCPLTKRALKNHFFSVLPSILFIFYPSLRLLSLSNHEGYYISWRQRSSSAQIIHQNFVQDAYSGERE